MVLSNTNKKTHSDFVDVSTLLVGQSTKPDKKSRTLLAGWWFGHPSEKYERQLG